MADCRPVSRSRGHGSWERGRACQARPAREDPPAWAFGPVLQSVKHTNGRFAARTAGADLIGPIRSPRCDAERVVDRSAAPARR
jgi:hypothetical protein